MIHFAQPSFWNGLLGVGFVAFLLVFLARLRRKISYRFGDKRLARVTARSFERQRFIWKEALIVAAFFFSVVALARPQWGFEWQSVKRQGLDILVVMDTSKSMLTEDVKPNRLERAKFAVKDLVKKLQGDRAGLIPFAGDAFLSCPLTTDYGGFLLSLDDVSVQTIPRGGTNIARAIEEALQGYVDVPAQYKVIVILTDGESLESDPLRWARTAAEKNVRIYTVGIGTREGELVKVTDESGSGGFLKDSSGNFVKSSLNEGALKEIAAITGGAYVRASGAELGLDYLYDHYLSHLEKRDIESRMEQRYHERFQFPLFAAFLLLLIEVMLSVRRPET